MNCIDGREQRALYIIILYNIIYYNLLTNVLIIILSLYTSIIIIIIIFMKFQIINNNVDNENSVIEYNLSWNVVAIWFFYHY